MDYGPLFGGEAEAGTIGGTIAANLSGRAIKAAPRAIIFSGRVTGRANHQVGGRVVKNVTGYDMCKVLADPGARSPP
jgi:glycolate oxidase FAD binding subunit